MHNVKAVLLTVTTLRFSSQALVFKVVRQKESDVQTTFEFKKR